MKSDELKKEVEQGFKKAQMRGISGVPFTIIDGQCRREREQRLSTRRHAETADYSTDKLAVSGAQETETFLEVFKQVADGKYD